MLNVGIIRDKKVTSNMFEDYLKSSFRSVRIIDIDPYKENLEQQIRGLGVFLLPEILDDNCYYWDAVMRHRKTIHNAIYNNGLIAIGICAGANALGNHVTFNHPDGRISNIRGLGITEGHYVGPVDRDRAPQTDHEEFYYDGTRALPVNYGVLNSFNIKAKFCYCDGPGYTPAHGEKIHSLVRYKDEDMMFYKYYGAGLAISMGVLPHMGTRHMIDSSQVTMTPENRKLFNQLKEDIKPFEHTRISLMLQLTSLIRGHRQNLARQGLIVLQPAP